MSGPLQGPSQDLGIQMRRGILAHFKHVNDLGGVLGRPLKLVSVNDNYDPDEAIRRTQQLLDVQQVMSGPNEPDIRGPNSVFALLGNVGTPTVLRTAPLATKNEVLFFGPFTGAQTYLRDGTNSPYVYNFRAGYYDEAEAIVDYIANDRIPRIVVDPDTDHKRILVFAQDDTYGSAGYRGITLAYNQGVGSLPSPDSIRRIGYTRDDVESVDPAIEDAKEFLEALLLEGTSRQSAAIVMVDTYLPGNRFIRGLKDWLNEEASRAERLDVLFVHVSFVGSDSLAESLTAAPDSYPDVLRPGEELSYAEGVMVTQVVPNYRGDSPGVIQYREDIDDFDDSGYSFTSLEGHLAARLFTTALELSGVDPTTERVQRALDTQIRNRDLGIGTMLNFSPDNHQASSTVWGTRIDESGAFSVPFVWNPEDGIRSN